ncbi:hypothetical protein GPS59_11425 [Acinetobacter haemolyticus]|uniref:hypothetical protein n=1 Tax=Acinetobacter haemolyticus TaxID=29430 RepID=UPI000AA0625F|nr:hypothetical protein [Acinetobacter haemolyticus]NAR54601.1 hypothetical protein [Acinetobacter haemolyticus]QHI23058.1 hypothetical protein Ahae5227_09265 [Acinetobacter haemolyticus]QHI26233.1 hypothetical protein Ahae2126ch_08660 [Acinetobacter haemolyticus]
MDAQKQREQRLITLRNTAIGAGAIGAGVMASNANAISTTDVQAAYTASGASETVDGTGIIIIGLVITIAVIGMIIGLVKKK